MEVKKKRLTLDLDPALQRRLKTVAALKGVSMRQYCQDAIEKELAKDDGASELGRPSFTIERMLALKNEIFQGRKLPGDSVEFIREARESRSQHVNDCRQSPETQGVDRMDIGSIVVVVGEVSAVLVALALLVRVLKTAPSWPGINRVVFAVRVQRACEEMKRDSLTSTGLEAGQEAFLNAGSLYIACNMPIYSRHELLRELWWAMCHVPTQASIEEARQNLAQ